MAHTPAPWLIGSVAGHHIRHGEAKCHFCDLHRPLLRVSQQPAVNPEEFTDTVHWHFWDGQQNQEYPGFHTIVSQDGFRIVGMYDVDEGGICTGWDDARLIAAAPRLLEAARKAFEKMKADDIREGLEPSLERQELAEAIRAALEG